MKAVLALGIIYVGTFFLVIQGASQNAVQASPQGPAAAQNNSASPQAHSSVDPANEKLLSTVPNNDKGQAFVNAFAISCQKKLDVDQVTDQLVAIYDKHFTDDEIKGLLQFYGSPLGQKVAAEMPKIGRETQAAVRAASTKAAKESLAEVKQQNPEIGQSARLWNGQGQGQGQQQRRGQLRGLVQPSQQQAAQQQDPE